MTRPLSRRHMLTVLVAAPALGACTRAPHGRIVPYVDDAPEVTPGVANRYATAMTLDGYAVGLVVESHEGRPTKIEGNPRHPSSLGAAGPFHQASLFGLYDPARTSAVRGRGAPRTFAAFARGFAKRRGVHILMEPQSSPLVVSLLKRARDELGAHLHFHTPLARDPAWAGAALAFGRPLEAHHELRRKDVIVALDADFLATGPAWLVDARAFADRRRVRSGQDSMSRLYVVEPSMSVTGMNADHRLRARALDVPAIAAALLAAVARAAGGSPIDGRLSALPAVAEHAAWLDAVARDLVAHRGATAVLAGDGQPSCVHAVAHAIDALLESPATLAGSPIFEAGTHEDALSALAASIDGAGDAVLVLGGNPVYDAPADVDLAAALRRAGEVVRLGSEDDETTAVASWSLPRAHYLEAWGDARAHDGTVSIVQPLIAPLCHGSTDAEVLAALLGHDEPDSAALVRRLHGELDDHGWREALASGVVAGTASPAVPATLSWDGVARALDALPEAPPRDALEVAFRPSYAVHDGRFAKTAVLQELPDPVTTLTWSNAALVAPVTAAAQGLVTGDVVKLAVGGRTIRAPLVVSPGHAEGSVSIALGYGPARGGGADAFRLRTRGALHAAPFATLTKTGQRKDLAFTQPVATPDMRDREIALKGTLVEYRADAKRLTRDANRTPETLYELAPANARQQWGMVIDLNACVGCNACVVACQTENNVPTVGEDGVFKGRHMHWLRIDHYFAAGDDDPDVHLQPMLCQHCEKAPCEYVCPVGATTHSPDGLNEMTYNRCVGTRFCSNNCPYKVRRFNWFNYNLDKPATLRMAMNPDVSVRARGVMEKCTYCVQRIREKEIVARREDRPIADGEVLTACQETCPTGAIVFGNLADPKAQVAALRDNDRTYAALDDLATLPHTRYMARLSNPNPDLPRGKGRGAP